MAVENSPTCAHHDCTRTAPGGYCAPGRCYCGACSWWRPDTAHPITPNILDTRAIASGQRRSSPAGYKAAQAAVTRRT